ncbi:MAG: hypothetical protein Q9167_001414 [Letrouitia subvulpina]
MEYQKDGDLAEVFGQDVPPTHHLRDLLSEGVQQNPHGTAIVSLYQSEHHLSFLNSRGAKSLGHLSWTYLDLQHAASRLATALHGHGARKGSVVATFLWNSIEWSLFFWAAAGLGASFVPLDPRSIHRPAELRHILQVLEIDVLVIEDRNSANIFEANANELARTISLKTICAPTEDNHPDGWRSFQDLRDETPLELQWNALDNAGMTQEAAVILFTSGSTGLPKACPHTATNLGSQSHSYPTARMLDSGCKLLLHSPNFHIAAVWNLICAWRAGAAVVIPSPRFDAEASLRGTKSEGCTHMTGTPSMVNAILNHPLFPSHVPVSLRLLGMGAEMVPLDLITRCREAIGSDVVIWSGWGMTEGVGLLGWDHDSPIPSHSGVVAVGKVLPGSRIRICEPGSRLPLKRGEIGELHCSGTSVIREYLRHSSGEEFYVDQHGIWFLSGDQALMDSSGSVYILGRYKDIIIRGGENISPATIESCLNGFGGIETQVVGISDTVMGEAPVAVVKNLRGHSQTSDFKSELRQLVNRELGTTFALGNVFTLEELNLEDFPFTTSGKVRKSQLKAHVESHMHEIDQQREHLQQKPLLGQITDIWSRVLGLPTDKIHPSTSVVDLADSLTIMRLCYEMEKSCGTRISLADIQQNETPLQQARLLESRGNTTEADALPVIPPRLGPPPVQEIAHVFGDLFAPNQVTELAKPALDTLNLNWQDDVEDVYRNNDMIMGFWSSQQRPAASNIRWAIQTTTSDPCRLRTALETALTRHSTFRSICVDAADGKLIHLIIRPSQRWFDQCIGELGQVHTADDVYALTADMSLKFGTRPGPLFHASIVPIESTKRLGMLMSVHHSTYDAFSFSIFMQDLDALLGNDTARLRDLTPFKLYADMYQLHKQGPAAMNDIRYSARRLEGVSNYSKAFWPPQRSAEWLIGYDRGWSSRNGEPGRPETRISLDPEEDRLWRYGSFPHFTELKRRHAIEASTVVKAAVALFNAEATGQPHAVFGNLDNARKWPFLETWVADRLPNPLSIAGPTMESTLNVLPVDAERETLAFLTYLQEDQIEQSRHVNAPFWAVMERLGEEEGKIAYDLKRRQVLNWDPSVRHRRTVGHQNMKVLRRKAWLDLGVFWNFGLANEETLFAFMLYDDKQLWRAEAEAALTRVFEILQWMTEPENWAKRIGECSKVAGV